MLERLVESNPWLLLCLLGVVCLTLFLLTVIVRGFSNSSRKQTAELQLKQDMVAKGLPATDIERVLWVSSTNAPLRDGPLARENLSDNEYSLVEKMLDDGRDINDIERVVRAIKGAPASAPARSFQASGSE